MIRRMMKTIVREVLIRMTNQLYLYSRGIP